MIFFSFVSQNNKYKYRKICYVFDIKFKLDPCISNYLELFQELVKENWWIISSREREREDTTINNLPSHFQKNDKEYFKKTLFKLFKSSLWVIGKSVKKRQLQHSHDSNFSQVWKSLSHFQYFLAHFHSQLSLLQITLTNFYKLKDSFIWKWIITIRRWKLEKYCTSSSASMSPVNFVLFFFLQRCTFQKESLIALQKLYCTSPRENLGYYTPFLCESLFNSLKDSSFLYFLCRTMLRIHLYLHIISFRIKLEFLAILKLG